MSDLSKTDLQQWLALIFIIGLVVGLFAHTLTLSEYLSRSDNIAKELSKCELLLRQQDQKQKSK